MPPRAHVRGMVNSDDRLANSVEMDRRQLGLRTSFASICGGRGANAGGKSVSKDKILASVKYG